MYDKKYIRDFNQAIQDNPQYYKDITEALWGYWGETPKAWMIQKIKEARVFLLTFEGKSNKTKRPYKNFKTFMGNQLRLKYQWEDPQGLKTYINNEEEQEYYKDKNR